MRSAGVGEEERFESAEEGFVGDGEVEGAVEWSF